MARKTFSQVLKDNNFNISVEFDRLYSLFYKPYGMNGNSLYIDCSNKFNQFPYKDTCISLDDFDKTFGFDFDSKPKSQVDLDYLISFCEYVYNLIIYLMPSGTASMRLREQIEKILEKTGYVGNKDDGLTDFVPKKPEAIIAAQSVDYSKLSYDILEYNHHSMKGNIEEKSKVLSSFANYFEPRRTELSNFNRSFEKNLFTMFNNFNIRHSNSSDYNPLFEGITDEKLEEYYDITYELCLTAFSILGGLESNKKAKEIRTKLGK